MHERPDGEPKGVGQAELVLQVLGLFDARIRVGPLVRADPGHDEQQYGHATIGGYYPQPDERAERRQKREKAGRALGRLLVQYTNACAHIPSVSISRFAHYCFYVFSLFPPPPPQTRLKPLVSTSGCFSEKCRSFLL